MRKIFTSIAAIVFFGMISGTGLAYAGEIDILLQKLVEKGVLTAGEAQQIGTETKEQIKADTAAGKNSSLPAWVQNTKLKGDFRARYQMDHAKTGDSGRVSDRNRGRVRLRIGVDSKVNDKIMVGAGISTGTTDTSSYDAARSSNQSFGNASAKKTLVLDYAYARYTPVSWATIMGGKMKYLPWRPTDVMIDNDATPEGGVLQLTGKLNDKARLFLDNMVFVLSETEPNTHNAMAYATQGGVEYQLTNNLFLKGAVSYYDFSNVKGRALDGSQGTNTKAVGSGASGANKYGFQIVTPAVEFGIKNPLAAVANATGLSKLDIEKLTFFGEYYQNTAAPAKKSGFASGVGFGNEKIDDWGKWQWQYVYSMLEKDSILDILPDSDRYSGKTGIRGHKLSFQYGLGKNTWLQFAGFRFENINQIGTNRRAPTTVFQADWNMKF
jgi:opacity protein-like surface antigen